MPIIDVVESLQVHPNVLYWKSKNILTSWNVEEEHLITLQDLIIISSINCYAHFACIIVTTWDYCWDPKEHKTKAKTCHYHQWSPVLFAITTESHYATTAWCWEVSSRHLGQSRRPQSVNQRRSGNCLNQVKLWGSGVFFFHVRKAPLHNFEFPSYLLPSSVSLVKSHCSTATAESTVRGQGSRAHFSDQLLRWHQNG